MLRLQNVNLMYMVNLEMLRRQMLTMFLSALLRRQNLSQKSIWRLSTVFTAFDMVTNSGG